ncbi:MAG: glutathionylspermidine synthase family protein [Labilithrix sp.]|nr:glutathionylspermidine synthase family protein [Labilithrix sp.]
MTAPLARVEALPVAEPLRLPSLERELVHRWLVWDAWVGGKRRVDLHPLVLSAAAHRDAVRAAERAWALVSAAADRAASDPEERARYRLHPDVERLAAASRAGGDAGSVARVDLLLREDGRFVACEVNADCPGGYNETLALPRLARAAGLARGLAGPLRDPTFVAGRLADRLVERSGGPGSPRGVVALAYATAYAEDLQVCALLERLVRERGGRAVRVSPTALVEAAGGGVAVRGERVAALYRFYPVEWMAGQGNVAALARATAAGALASLSSFACIHAQSKLAMARAFAHDRAAAAEVFPETVAFSDLERGELERARASWVVKRDLSRVGDHVFVGALTSPEEFREILAAVADVERCSGEAAARAHAVAPAPAGPSLGANDAGQAWIAQRFVPQAPLATPWGTRLVTLGVYLMDGAFAGYFARLSPTSHCSHDALALPVFVEDASAVAARAPLEAAP